MSGSFGVLVRSASCPLLGPHPLSSPLLSLPPASSPQWSPGLHKCSDSGPSSVRHPSGAALKMAWGVCLGREVRALSAPCWLPGPVPEAVTGCSCTVGLPERTTVMEVTHLCHWAGSPLPLAPHWALEIRRAGLGSQLQFITVYRAVGPGAPARPSTVVSIAESLGHPCHTAVLGDSAHGLHADREEGWC